MKMKTYGCTGTYEILGAAEFVGLPISLEEDTLAGKVVTAADGNVGVLLHDVIVDENPNGCLVVAGVLDLKKIKAHLGDAYDESDYTSLPDTIICRPNIGVTE